MKYNVCKVYNYVIAKLYIKLGHIFHHFYFLMGCYFFPIKLSEVVMTLSLTNNENKNNVDGNLDAMFKTHPFLLGCLL